VFYDQNKSNGGITQSILKFEKRKAVDSESIIKQEIITPDLEDGKTFNTEDYMPEKIKEQRREDPVLSKKPMAPLSGPQGRGGR